MGGSITEIRKERRSTQCGPAVVVSQRSRAENRGKGRRFFPARCARRVKHAWFSPVLALLGACSTSSAPTERGSVDAGVLWDLGEATTALGDASLPTDAVRARTPPLRVAVAPGFAPDTLYWGPNIYQSSRTGPALEEMRREADLPAFCLEAPDGRRAQWTLGAVLPWNVMVDDPNAWTRVKAGLDAARAAGVPMRLGLDITRWPTNLPEAASAEARGERLCAGYPCPVPFSPLATDFWDAAARWQAEAARELEAYLGDPVVLLVVLGEPSIDVARWTLPVPPTHTRQAWVSLQLRQLNQRMIAALQRVVGDRASVTVASVPGFLQTPESQLRWGVRPEDYNAVCDESLAGGVLGINVYEQPHEALLERDLTTAQRYCTRFQDFFAVELGVVDTAIAQDDFVRWTRLIGTLRFGQPSRLLGATVYCWNCIADSGGPTNSLRSEQRRWLGDGLRALAGGSTRACSPRCARHPRWTGPAMMATTVGSSVDLQATMPSGCDDNEVFVQSCCHSTNCVYAQGLDEDTDCPMALRGVSLTPEGRARIRFDATRFNPGWVRVYARGAGAPGPPPFVRVQLARE